jgi:endonuclease III
MFNPKTPLHAGLIFLGGVGFIGWTITDIQRVSKQNDLPPTKDQEKQLAELHKFIEGARRKAAGTWTCKYGHATTSSSQYNCKDLEKYYSAEMQ